MRTDGRRFLVFFPQVSAFLQTRLEFLRGLGTHHVLLDGERFALSAGDEHEGQEAVHVSLEEEEEEGDILHQATTIISPVFPPGPGSRTDVAAEPTRMSKTWLTSFPRISMLFISRISSPSDSRPLRSAAPPRTMRLMITLSISLRTVAPCRKQETREQDKFRDFTDNDAGIGYRHRYRGWRTLLALVKFMLMPRR